MFSLVTIFIVAYAATNVSVEEKVSINRGQKFLVEFTPSIPSEKKLKDFTTYDFGIWNGYMASKTLEEIFNIQFTTEMIEKYDTRKDDSFDILFKALNPLSILRKAYFKNKENYEFIGFKQ